MKKSFGIAATVFLFALLVGPALAEETDLDQGFLGTPWGANISTLPSFAKIAAKGNVDFYVNKNEDFTIGETALPYVFYGFCDGQFYAVYVKVTSMDAFQAAMDYISPKYGAPKEKKEGDQIIYQWKHKDIKIKLKHDTKTGKLKMSFYYEPLAEKVNMWPFEQLVDDTEKKKPEQWRMHVKQDPRQGAIGIPLLRF